MTAERKIMVLVGTMTGNAELAAETMGDILRDEFGFAVDVVAMDGLDAGVFTQAELYLICTSTYGDGDPPDNALAFYGDLRAKRPHLGHVRFGVFGLGDSTYRATYNFGGKLFEELLLELGATRVGARAKHDWRSTVPPEEFGAAWVREWAALLDAPPGRSSYIL